jgi:hypothetical protein
MATIAQFDGLETQAELLYTLAFRASVVGALSTGPRDCDSQPTPARLRAVAASRRRGPSLARRTYQAGNVYQKGKTQSDRWDSNAPAYGRFWKDFPGRRPRRVTIPLGLCRTRSIAERKCADHIEGLGINSTRHQLQATSSTTFKEQAELWLRSLAKRKLDPVEHTTIDTRRYALDKWILPSLGDTCLADVNNFALKELVEKMAAALSPASIRDYANIVKAVVASATDENGEERFPRKWNRKIIDAPPVRNQRQPSTDAEGISAIIKAATGQYRVLYTLLAGCGPMRAGETLGLEIGKHISGDCRTLYIRQKAKRGLIQPYLKTQNGERDVDLCNALAEILRGFIGGRTTGLLFHTPSGAQLLQTNILRDSLHPILKRLELTKGGFNIFRRYRITHIKMGECPDFLQHFWSGHAARHVSERYTKLTENREFRLRWAESLGLGFDLPQAQKSPAEAQNGRFGRLLQFRKAV